MAQSINFALNVIRFLKLNPFRSVKHWVKVEFLFLHKKSKQNLTSSKVCLHYHKIGKQLKDPQIILNFEFTLSHLLSILTSTINLIYWEVLSVRHLSYISSNATAMPIALHAHISTWVQSIIFVLINLCML